MIMVIGVCPRKEMQAKEDAISLHINVYSMHQITGWDMQEGCDSTFYI